MVDLAPMAAVMASIVGVLGTMFGVGVYIGRDKTMVAQTKIEERVERYRAEATLSLANMEKQMAERHLELIRRLEQLEGYANRRRATDGPRSATERSG